MDDFKGRHFSGEVVLWAVRWYCRYGISYRDLETMMVERGVRLITRRFTAGFSADGTPDALAVAAATVR